MRFIFFLLTGIGLLVSCNEEITVGSSLLEDGAIEVSYTDSLELEGQTVESKPVVVYRNALAFTRSTYLLGQLNDPVFGKSVSDVYISVGLVNNQFPSFDTLSIDSVVMVIPLDTLGRFGEDGALHEITVSQLTENFSADVPDTIFSNQVFDTEPELLATVSKKISHADSVNVYSPALDSVIILPPQLRIALDTQLWHTVATDTLINRDGLEFRNTVRGFRLSSETTASSIIGLNLGSSSNASIELYYSSGGGSNKSVYFFDLAAVRSNNFIHDISGSELESSLASGSTEFLYLQEMQGPNIEFDISPVKNYSDQVINRASIELYVLKETNPLVPAVNFLEVSYIDSLGNNILVFDNRFRNQNRLAIEIFGGTLESTELSGVELYKYSFDLTNHVNNIISSSVSTSKIIVSSGNNASGARRSIVYGAGSAYPPILKLITSNP